MTEVEYVSILRKIFRLKASADGCFLRGVELLPFALWRHIVYYCTFWKAAEQWL